MWKGVWQTKVWHRFLWQIFVAMFSIMRLRSHTARKHFPQLPDELWLIILNMLINANDTIELSYLFYSRLRRTCKAFNERCTLCTKYMTFIFSSAYSIHRLFNNVTIDTTKVRFLDLKDCILTVRDQFALSSSKWHLQELSIHHCKFADYYLAKLLSCLVIQPWMHIHIVETFGLLCGFHLAYLLQDFHRMNDADSKLLVRWQSNMYEHNVTHVDAYTYVLAGIKEVWPGNYENTHLTPQTRINTIVDIAGSGQAVRANYLWDRRDELTIVWKSFCGNHSHRSYNVPSDATRFPILLLSEMPVPQAPEPKVNLVLKGDNKESEPRRMSSRFMLQ